MVFCSWNTFGKNKPRSPFFFGSKDEGHQSSTSWHFHVSDIMKGSSFTSSTAAFTSVTRARYESAPAAHLSHRPAVWPSIADAETAHQKADCFERRVCFLKGSSRRGWFFSSVIISYQMIQRLDRSGTSIPSQEFFFPTTTDSLDQGWASKI